MGWYRRDIKLESPNGSAFRVQVADSGAIVAVPEEVYRVSPRSMEPSSAVVTDLDWTGLAQSLPVTVLGTSLQALGVAYLYFVKHGDDPGPVIAGGAGQVTLAFTYGDGSGSNEDGTAYTDHLRFDIGDHEYADYVGSWDLYVLDQALNRVTCVPNIFTVTEAG